MLVRLLRLYTPPVTWVMGQCGRYHKKEQKTHWNAEDWQWTREGKEHKEWEEALREFR